MPLPWGEMPFFNVVDYYEFLELVPSNSHLINFEHKLFNPLLHHMLDDDNTNNDHDYDTENYINNCHHNTLTSFNDKLNSNNTNNLSMIHTNIRSLRQNKWKLQNLITSIDKHISIIALTETWLYSDQEATFKSFHNHKGFFKSRNTRGGGVGLYIHNSLQVKERPDLRFNNNNCDVITVEIEFENDKNILVTAIYKPPNENIEDFNFDFDNYLSVLSNEKKFNIICFGRL